MVLDRRYGPSARGILVLSVILCGHLGAPRFVYSGPSGEVEPDTLVYELPEIEVTATRMTPTLYHSPASVSVLTWRRLEARHVRTGSEMLEEVPSVVIERTRKGAFGCPTIRGFGTSNILVLLDGMPVNTGFGNWPNLLSLPMNDVERIEVIKGSNAILYGPNAMGGVVNITTGRAAGRPPPLRERGDGERRARAVQRELW